MNLHNIVRGAINVVNRDRICSLFVSTGKQRKDSRGLPVQTYYEFPGCRCQFQSMSSDAIQFKDNIELTTITRKVYLYATDDLKTRPWSGYRPLSRVGDYLQDESLQFWRVVAVLEDFSVQGWVSLQVTMEMTPKTLVVDSEVMNE